MLNLFRNKGRKEGGRNTAYTQIWWRSRQECHLGAGCRVGEETPGQEEGGSGWPWLMEKGHCRVPELCESQRWEEICWLC